MNTHADKTQENKSQSVANSISQKQSGESTFQFVDNRPEAVAQRKLQGMADGYSAQQQQPIQKKENNTGLPDNLKAGMENLSGMSLDDVSVHRNSDKPAQLNAHAYAQGTDIHLGPGQEKHLPHEAWHVVQQKQGRVKPTMQMKGKVDINDDVGLEKEADVMGTEALQNPQEHQISPRATILPSITLQPKKRIGGLLTSNNNAPFQLVPADFKPDAGLKTWNQKPGWALGMGEKSPYKMLQESLRRYSELRVDQEDKRVEELMVISKHIQRWGDHHNVDDKEIEEFSSDELLKIGAIDELADKIGHEWVALGTVVEGTLGEGEIPDQVLADPALTKNKKASGKAKTGFFNQNVSIVNTSDDEVGKVNANTLCMATRKDAPEGKKQIDYWYVEPADPELDGVEIFGNQGKNQLGFTKGYVLAAHVTIGSQVEARDDLQYSKRDNRSLFPLFPRTPTSADVKQIGLGDCYLQSALISIANQSPGLFPSIMKDNGGSVTILLNDIIPGDPKTYTPRRITVKKSVVTYNQRSRKKKINKGDEAFSGGALWAQMMEKAYVAAGFLGGSPETMPVEGGASYGRIESGNSNIAFEHILGRKAELDLIQPIAYEFYKAHSKKTWVGDMDFSMAVTKPITDEIALRVDQEVEGQEDPKISELVQLNKAWIGKKGILEKELLALHEGNSQVRLFEVEALIQKVLNGNLSDLADRAVDWVRTKRIYPGKRGSGLYNQAQDDLFAKIHLALESGKYVNVGSNESIASVKGGIGSSSNEHTAKGLAGPHGYAVLDTNTTDDMDNVANAPDLPLKMLKLRNPWGHYGREYYFKNGGKVLTAKEFTGNGEFWLTLSDLTKRFNQVSFG